MLLHCELGLGFIFVEHVEILELLCTSSHSLFATAKLQETAELDLRPSGNKPASLTVFPTVLYMVPSNGIVFTKFMARDHINTISSHIHDVISQIFNEL